MTVILSPLSPSEPWSKPPSLPHSPHPHGGSSNLTHPSIVTETNPPSSLWESQGWRTKQKWSDHLCSQIQELWTFWWGTQWTSEAERSGVRPSTITKMIPVSSAYKLSFWKISSLYYMAEERTPKFPTSGASEFVSSGQINNE